MIVNSTSSYIIVYIGDEEDSKSFSALLKLYDMKVLTFKGLTFFLQPSEWESIKDVVEWREM